MLALDTAEVVADLTLQLRVGAVEEMHQQHEFGRDRGVGLKLEHPMPVGVLMPAQARQLARATASWTSCVDWVVDQGVRHGTVR